MARRRGGYQKPSQPAAASGPGALSQRTDGNVPALQRTGLGYGENKAVNEQQSAAPISPGSGVPPAPGQGGPPPGFGPAGAFSPTGRPGEPMTAGTDFGPGAGRVKAHLPEDPYLVAKALYSVAPSPQLERIIARLAGA